MKQKWTIKQRGETIGVFASADEATEYAHKVMRLPASVDVCHGDHIRSYLYTDAWEATLDWEGKFPAAVVVPCDAAHVPTYRA